MKRGSSILMVFVLMLSLMSVTAHDKEVDYEIKTLHFDISVPSVDLVGKGKCISLDVEDNDGEMISYLMEGGKPKLPMIVKHVELPFSAKDINVRVSVGSTKERILDKDIEPAAPMLPLRCNSDIHIRSFKDHDIYTSDKPYPSSWFKFFIRSGLNERNVVVKHLSVYLYPYRYIPASKKLLYTDEFKVTVTYLFPRDVKKLSFENEYDMVIIAPSCFAKELQRLVEHKNKVGVKTFLKTTEDIYREFPGRDKPEKIKYFIKYAKENYNITYVLLVGGLKSKIWAKPRDDPNQGSKYWYLPVRYTNLYDHPKYPLGEKKIFDPGVISDLYYADIYDGNGNFSSWDTNNDGIFAAWGKPGVENDTDIDLCPDVIVGRLPCRNLFELRTVINKIIRYENSENNYNWFKRIIVISGDGFLDQQDLDIQWNTTGLPDGTYTIYAQAINKDGIAGEIDRVTVKIDRKERSKITFDHDDHKKIKTYPALPVAEITSPSDGDILGKTDVFFSPGENKAYCNQFTGWANVTYKKGVMHIRGKCYDPRPYGNITSIHVWVENEDHEIVFSAWRNNTEMYYEGEWITGEKLLNGRGGALYYMPDDFEKVILWTSNGKFRSMNDVIRAISEGAGFVFMSGHGSPNAWADHLPGVPGNRRHGSVTGLEVVSFNPIRPFPMKMLRNFGKLPVIVIGGCHNSQFNVSAIPAFMHYPLYLLGRDTKMWTYGVPVPECFSWYLVKLPGRGAIATIGNTGLGYGRMGRECTSTGGDGWITIEFFRQYGEKGHDILGDAFAHAVVEYVNTFDMSDLESGHAKTVEQWVLFGDPSLKLGGYSFITTFH